MNAIRVETVIQSDGELHLSHLPCRKGERVEAIVLLLDSAQGVAMEREAQRAAALRQLLERAKTSQFRSTGPYPTRDELHERS